MEEELMYYFFFALIYKIIKRLDSSFNNIKEKTIKRSDINKYSGKVNDNRNQELSNKESKQNLLI